MMNDEKGAALNEKGIHEYSLARKLMPYVVLAIMLSLSAATWLFFKNLHVEREERRFNR